MTSIREDVAEVLGELLDADRYRVYGYPYSPDMIEASKRAVCVWTEGLTRDATLKVVRFQVKVWVLSPRDDTSADTEADLETCLYDVLGALSQGNPAWTWTTAERGVLDDTWAGFQFNVTAVGRIQLPREDTP